MNVLITGGAGYKGILLTQALLKAKHEVTILDNFMYGYDSVLHLLEHKHLTIVARDIRNDISQHVKSADVIYHLAGISGYPACEANPSSAQMINVEATRNVLNGLSKDQTVIYASTTSFYGASGKACDENSAAEPTSLYGITKLKAEEIVMEQPGSISLRFATVFGVSPKMRSDLLVNDFTQKAMHDRCIVLFEGKTRRTFLHIKDAVSAYVFALENRERMKDQIYNVGTERMNYTKLEIANVIKEQTKCTVIDSDIADMDLRNFRISFKKIEKLGYQAKVSLDDGVKELVRLYQFYRPNANFKTI